MSDQPTPLPPERRAEIERREKAATLGPWEACKTDLRCLIEAGVYSNGIRIAGMIAPLRKLEQYRDANAEFIAHARTDIPDLLREVKRQAGEIAQRKFAADRQADEILELRRAVNHLQSRLDALPVKVWDLACSSGHFTMTEIHRIRSLVIKAEGKP